MKNTDRLTPKVVLLSHTVNPEILVSLSARQSRDSKPASDYTDLLENSSPEDLQKARELIIRVMGYGHESIVEHITFTFSISNISRTCTHQLVRHRIGSYTEQSMRYVKYENVEPIIPPSFTEEQEACYRDHFKRSMEAYHKLIEMGCDKEDARFILPNGFPTMIVVTMNARSLINFFNLRVCEMAQWEIRKVAREMLKICRKIAPSIFKNAGICPKDCSQKSLCPKFKRMEKKLKKNNSGAK